MKSFKYHAGAARLRDVVEALELGGRWSHGPNGKHTYRPAAGGVINYWSRTGRVHCQGPSEIAAHLDHELRGALAARASYPGLPPLMS